MSLVREYGGVVLDQNQKPVTSADYIDVTDGLWRYQEAFLPANYPRGESSDERFLPPLSGWQVLVGVDEGYATTASLDWTLEYELFGVGWILLTQGTTIGTHADGDKLWFDAVFDQPIEVTETILVSRLRFGFRARTISGGYKDEPVIRLNDQYVVNNEGYPVVLTAGVPYPVINGGRDGFLFLDPSNNAVTYSDQQGISKVWFSNPNPYALRFAQAYEADGTTPIQQEGADVSICFRVLGLVADDGVDFLGNPYRSAVISSKIQNVSRIDGEKDKSWMSKPNPSRFAVESQYFDMRDAADSAVVIDNVLVDPETPGVYFNIYYSSEGDPGVGEADWENKLWVHVPTTFHAVKRETHTLPSPIIAKYIKIEYSHLQARYYAPGDFAKPMKYKKHPKWVLDYFLARVQAEKAVTGGILHGRVSVIYDALDLAYNYYLDDLDSSADVPVEIDQKFSTTTKFLAQRDDLSDQVDSETLTKINLALAPYRSRPSVFSKSDYLLGAYTQQVAPDILGYPTEVGATAFPDLAELRDESVIYESDFPIMFFYLTCRHKYREVVASFSHDRAYFVGIKEIAFTRERYSTAHDTDQYQEPAGDLLNVERNDFAVVDGVMTI